MVGSSGKDTAEVISNSVTISVRQGNNPLLCTAS